jgi:hypothetical protein
MDKETYYLKLQELIDKVKYLKEQIILSDDEEKTEYLKLAVGLVYEKIRKLMEYHNNL